MGRSIAAVGFVALLAACAPQPVCVEGVAHPIPEPPPLARPRLPIADLTAVSSPGSVMRAYAASIESCTGYAEELEQLLGGYRR